ncbi:MAG: valine--tRNA ligase [Candidatus Nanoarchaeia archaeon]|nr:valine--tRNA ligase [Candidatus Nanoarchaeia archaeon]
MINETRWDKSMEEPIINEWVKKKLYSFEDNSKKPVYSIDTPPPYINTPIHIGHGYTFICMDMMARYKRMKGFNVLFPLGLDCNGLPIEIQTEKQFNVSIRTTPREEFVKKCREMLDETSDISTNGFKGLGIGFNDYEFDYSKIGSKYRTDDPEYRALTQKTFKDAWDKGLIYEDNKPTNYCPVCRTTIADSEIDYKEEKSALNDIKFKVKETEKDIIISTTRPELLNSCQIILFNPNDDRYKNLQGKHAILPIYDREVLIKAHPAADKDFGSGLVMICSFGDTTDIRLFIELGLEPIYSINEEGKMMKVSGPYEGMNVKDARKKIIEDLKEKGFLVDQKIIDHRTPVCERSKNPIEFIAMKEFYLKQMDWVSKVRKAADEIEFYAPESKQLLLDWLNSISIDWPISRRRYYSTEIPIWYCKKCKYTYVNDTGKYLRPWIDSCPLKKCPKCNSNEWEGEKRILDTWFDSSISELFILGYDSNPKFFKNNYPCTMRPQGKEIVRTWLYYTILRGLQLTETTCFKQAWIHKHVVDEQGYKMSKSKGNGIDPRELISKFGCESIRFWTAMEGDITKGDIRCSFTRVEGAGKFISKLWNIARFISGFESVSKEPKELNKTDEWIMNELNKVLKDCDNHYNNYDFNGVAKIIRNFVWETYASSYLEMVKRRAYDKDSSALYTLYKSFKIILLTLAPIIPVITEKLFKEMYSSESIHLQKFPESGETKLSELTSKIIEFNSLVWAKKKEGNKSLKDSIKIEIPKELILFKEDLTNMHNIE